MRRIILACALLLSVASLPADEKSEPKPPVVTPGDKPGAPPSDAIVLFDGRDFSKWSHTSGKEAPWDLKDGAMVCKPFSGSIMTKENFSDVQLHIEFAPPLMPEKTSQDRGNSGVYLQGRYEVQVLDSYKSDTYSNGQCGAIYSEHPPLVNACRPPEQWQTYDIIFRAPKFDAEGKKTQAGSLTVLHNGVLIQDHAPLGGSTTASLYKEQPGDGPIMLQDHECLVRYRNIWIRKLN